MIQIKRPNLDEIALEYYNKLNPLYTDIGNGGYSGKDGNKYSKKPESLIWKLNKDINSNKPPELRNFYKLLLDEQNKYSKLKKLIIGKPSELEDLIIDIEKHLDDANITVVYEKPKNSKNKDYAIKNIFNYDVKMQSLGYWLAEKLQVNVCPYCNRQYTFTIGNDSKKGTRPQFDHFFDKATYPYLALSFYNLIPSCSICNSSLKGSEKFTLNKNIHPYLEGSEDVKFSIKVKNSSFAYDDIESFRISFKTTPNYSRENVFRTMRNFNVFKIRELYNQHKDYVMELIHKNRIYNQD